MKHFALAALLAATVVAPVESMAQNRELDQQVRVDELAARVANLEGISSVKKLQRSFGYFMDRGLWRQAAQLFTQDGTVEIGVDGVYQGPARIEEYLRRLHASDDGIGQEGLIYGQLNEWVTLQPSITIADDGQSARGRWRDLGMLGQYKEHAEWRDGIYENSYEKGADGIWRIKSLHLYVNFVADYKEGWARLDEGEGLQPSAASQSFAPDAPSTGNYQPFPANYIPPFSAPNPVTGQAVEVAQ